MHRAFFAAAPLLLFIAAGSPSMVHAQDQPDLWGPSPGMVGVSWGGYGTDSETMRRAGLWWMRSSSHRLGATGAFWGWYRHLEIESRWVSPERTRLLPFIAISGTAQMRGHREGIGPGFHVGAEYYVAPVVAVSTALGWRWLFTRWRELGYAEDPVTVSWFTIRFEVLAFLGG